MQRQALHRLPIQPAQSGLWRNVVSRTTATALGDRYLLIRSFFRSCKEDHHPTHQQRKSLEATWTSGHHYGRTTPFRTERSRKLFHSSFLARADQASPHSRNSTQDEGSGQNHHAGGQRNTKTYDLDHPSAYSNFENYPRFFRRLAMSLPPMHRPTKDDFLNLTTSFWQRLRVHFKWFTIRSFRKFNADDISAFITWFLMSQTLWILVGTTTFFSVVFATANYFRLQENVARAISNYLTSETGITIIFESAIVPKWKDSRISFKNVYISRRPSSDEYTKQTKDLYTPHRVAAQYELGSYTMESTDADEIMEDEYDFQDTNYSMFDLNIDSIDVTLSLTRWLDGKGLVVDAVVKGVRGVLDRRHITYDPDSVLDPASFRHAAQPGDFDLEHLHLEDVLITVYQPGSFRPYTASIFAADLKRFRKRWVFFDFLAAENIVGQFDNCLFSLHKPQSIGRTTEQDMQDSQWARMSRVRIDGVNIDHLQAMTTQEGPISWITSGKLDAVFDIKFPRSEEDFDFNILLGEIADAIQSVASDRIPGQRELAKPAITAPDEENITACDTNMNAKAIDGDIARVVAIDIDLRFRDLKAAVPIFTKDLSYVNNALIRPIVAFINANRTLVPIHCRISKDLDSFDGAYTMWETGLMDDIAVKVYDALAYHVTQANFNRRLKTVSMWSLQKTASVVISTMQSIIDMRSPGTLLETP